MSDLPPINSSDFRPTRWTLVRRAGVPSAEGRQALADLCEAYWRPVQRFLRCEGRSDDEASKLTQEFFAGVIQRGKLGAPSSARGRFRSYLLGAVKHFLADRRKAAGRLKRGGAIVAQSLDADSGGDDSSPGLQIPDAATEFDETYFILINSGPTPYSTGFLGGWVKSSASQGKQTSSMPSSPG